MDMAGLGGAGRSGPRGPVSDEMLVRTLYAEHAGPLLRYAFHLTSGDRQRAEDIVQETLLRAWLHPDAIAERPARPWLFAVARNLAVDSHRARNARPAPGAPPGARADLLPRPFGRRGRRGTRHPGRDSEISDVLCAQGAQTGA